MELWFFFIVFIILPCVCLIIFFISTAINTAQDNKKRKAHPQFYAWIAELNERISQSVKYHNINIVPLKRLVDNILKEWEYYDEEMRFRKGADLELYRMNIQRHQRVLDNMRAEENRLRELIRKYNKEHNLESGWND